MLPVEILTIVCPRQLWYAVYHSWCAAHVPCMYAILCMFVGAVTDFEKKFSFVLPGGQAELLPVGVVPDFFLASSVGMARVVPGNSSCYPA